MNDRRFAVILAGGKGERFWPLSTASQPKQLISLVGDKPFLAQSVERVREMLPDENIYIVTNQELEQDSREVAHMLPPTNVVGEPMGRDTAAAVALGAVLVESKQPDGVFCILTADHVIKDIALFRKTLGQAMALAANEELLVTIGIQPARPSTSFGYVEAGDPYATRQGIEFLRARKFVEKPDRETAHAYLDAGNYYWNSGMFIWSLAALKKAFKRHAPHLLELMEQLRPAVGRPGFVDEIRRVYELLPKISIDYALMEKADNIVMVKGIFDWDDVGSWPALENHFEKAADGNVVIGDCQSLDAHGNIVYSKDRLTALIGVEDLVVVQTEGVTLICPKNRSQDVKKLYRQVARHNQYQELL